MADDFEDDGSLPGGPKPYIDRQEKPVRAGLVCPDVRGNMSAHSIEARQAEFEGLAAAIRLDIAFSEVVKVREIKPATFIGGGHVETLAQRVKDDEIELLLVDAALSPIQQRNLERENRHQGARPDRADPRDLRRARGHPRRRAAGRTGPSQLPEEPPRALLDPPRAPAWQRRHGLHGRPG